MRRLAPKTTSRLVPKTTSLDVKSLSTSSAENDFTSSTSSSRSVLHDTDHLEFVQPQTYAREKLGTIEKDRSHRSLRMQFLHHDVVKCDVFREK